MNNKQLAVLLTNIASGNCYSESALFEAKHHSIATVNDRLCINRFLYGTPDLADKMLLKDIAFYIAEQQ